MLFKKQRLYLSSEFVSKFEMVPQIIYAFADQSQVIFSKLNAYTMNNRFHVQTSLRHNHLISESQTKHSRDFVILYNPSINDINRLARITSRNANRLFM